MQNPSCLCQCNTDPHANALFTCTWTSLHSFQNSTCKLWFSTLCNGKGPVSHRSLHMLWNVLWCGSLWPEYPYVFCCSSHTISMAEMYTKVTLTCAPFMYVKDILNNTSMQETQPQTYICMENWPVTVLLTTPAHILILVLNWLWIVSFPPPPP